MEMKSSSSSCCSPMVIAGGLDSCLFVWNAVTSACIANFQLPPDQHVNALCSPCLSSTSCSSLSRALALDADDVEDEEDEEDRNYYRDRYQSEAFQDPSPSHLSSSFSCYTLQKSRRRTSSQSSSCSRDHHYHVGRANCDGGGVKETQEKKETREKETPCTASSLHLPFVVAAGNPSVSVFDVSLLAERSSEIPPYVTLQGHTRNVRDVTFLSNQSPPFQPLTNAASSSTHQLDSSRAFSHSQNDCEKERIEGACGNSVEKDEEEKNRNVLFNGRDSSGVVCSCSEDGSCRIWDLRTSRQQMVFEHEGRVPIHSISGVCTAHVPHYVFMAVASGSIMAWDLRSNFSWEMTRPVRRQAVNLVSVSRLNTEIAVVTKYNSFNTFSLLSAPFSSSTSCGTPSSQSPCGSPSVLSSSSCVGSIFLSHRSQFFPHGPNNVLSCRYCPQLKRLPLQEKRLFVSPALSSSSSTFSPPSSLTLHSLPSSSSCSSPPSSPDSQKRTRSTRGHSQRHLPVSSSSSSSYLELRRKQEDLGGQRKQEDYARSWWCQQRYAQEWWHKRGGGVWWQHLEDEKEEALWGERERKSTWNDQVKSGGKWWKEFHGAKPWWCQEAESHAWWQRYEKGKKAWWERPRLESSKYLHQWRKLHYQTGGWHNMVMLDNKPSSSSSSCFSSCFCTKMTTASSILERDRACPSSCSLHRREGGSPRRTAASLCSCLGEQEKGEGMSRRQRGEEEGGGGGKERDVTKEGAALECGETMRRKSKKKNHDGWGWESNTSGMDEEHEDDEERRRNRSSSSSGRRRTHGDGVKKTVDEEKGEGGERETIERSEWKKKDEESEDEDGMNACCRCSRRGERKGEEEEEEKEKKTYTMMERLVTTGSDGVCILWKKEGDDGEWIPEREFLGHEKWVWDCAFSEDGRVFVTAGSDGTCKLWCVETGNKLLDYLPERRHPLSVNGRNLRSDKALLAVALLDFPLTYV